MSTLAHSLVANTATEILAASAARRGRLVLTNRSDHWVFLAFGAAGSGLTLATGLPLAPAASFPLEPDEATGAVWAICEKAAVISSNLTLGPGLTYTSTAVQTRPANTTPYDALDVVGTDPAAVMEFANIGPAGGQILLTSSLLRIDVGTVPSGMGEQRLHLFSSAPTALIDGAAFNVIAADRARYLGFISLGSPVDVGDTVIAQSDSINKVVRLASGSTSLWAQRQTVGGYTPLSATVSTTTLHAAAL